MRAPVAIVVAALWVTSCTDPVRDAAIEALGGEAPGVPPGPLHRRGQPCLLCHSTGGPAEDKPFAVAGTVYRGTAADAEGAEGYEVRFVDAKGGSPRNIVLTNEAGNFWVPAADWSVTFPFRTAIFRDGELAANMNTLVHREGSCNFCHRPTPPDKATDQAKEESRRYYGQIFVAGN